MAYRPSYGRLVTTPLTQGLQRLSVADGRMANGFSIGRMPAVTGVLRDGNDFLFGVFSLDPEFERENRFCGSGRDARSSHAAEV